MNIATARSASEVLSREDRALVVAACASLIGKAVDPGLVAAYLIVVAEFIRLGLPVEDIEALLGTPTTQNKALEGT